MYFFFKARAEKGIARHINASSVLSTLIDNGKLINQIARLAEIVVKYTLNIQDERGDVNSEALK